jgi:hypothetical protein
MPTYKFPDEAGDVPEVDVVITQQDGDDKDDDFEVEVVDDTPEKDRGRKALEREVVDPTDAEIENYTKGAQERIKELTHARHDERRAKEALQREKQEYERLAQHMHEENKRLKQYVDSGTQQYSEMAKSSAETELANARRDYKAAYEAGDSDALVTAQEALTDAKMKVSAAKNFRPAPVQQEENVVQTRQPAPASVQPDEKTLRWQAKNQWFGASGFEDVSSFALGLHQNLVNNGVDPRSDEYFERIDARMKAKFPEVFGETQEKPRAGESKRPASVVASAARSSGTKKIQLTTTQVALARKYGLTPQQYAAEVAKLERQNG